MKVAIMGRSVRPGATGVGNHIGNLIRGVAGRLPDRSLTVFLTRDAPAGLPPGICPVRAPFPTPNEYCRAFWEQTLVPLQASARGIEVYHCPNYILPFALRCPSVVTVHDLSYLQQQIHRRRSHYYLSALSAFAIKKAHAIVAVSEYTRHAIEEHYPEAAGRVEVIYQGVGDHIVRPPEPAVHAFRERRGLTDPYVLFVGTLEPRKNVPRLLAAFQRAIDATGAPHRLLLVGPWGWRTGEIEEALKRVREPARILRLGYIPAEELSYCYAGASAFVYPSLEEGFGLPPLEAMTCGTPVITSNTSSLPEVVGDAALTIDPTDTGAIADAIARILTDNALARALRLAGARQSRCFSWDTAAQQHIDLYERVIGGSSPVSRPERRPAATGGPR